MRAAEVKEVLKRAGVFRSAIAEASAVSDEARRAYGEWITEGLHGSMGYLEKYDDLRSDPRLLLPGARSVVSCAFSYHSAEAGEGRDGLLWAEYALGDDYHEVVRARLSGVAATISERTGAECRVCVDTTPLRERYWAVKSGLGIIGLNNQLIIPGAGSRFFLGEIITTLPLEADRELSGISCGECGRCVSACPGRALTAGADGHVRLDARRCLSYLTIEHRGELPEGTALDRHIYGCDECQRVCPHNQQSPLTEISEFKPRRAILDLTLEDISGMTQEEFSATFRHSAIKRTKLAGLQRNAEKIARESKKKA